jgi:hypothetical protein
MGLSRHLIAALREMSPLNKAEDPAAYAKLASTGFILAHPVKIKGHDKRSDNNIPYHSTIKFFDKEGDSREDAHKTASSLDHQHIDPKKVGISTDKLKDRNGNDVYAVKLHGPHADKLKEHHEKFGHMGHPENYKWGAHISVPKAVHDEIKSKGHKTAHEAGIEFGNAELRRGPETLHTYEPKMEKSEMDKSDYGPKGADLYNAADNAKRKMNRTSDIVEAAGPNKAVKATTPSLKSQAEKEAQEAKAKSRNNPVKVFSMAEKRAFAKKTKQKLAKPIKTEKLAASEDMQKGALKTMATGAAMLGALAGGGHKAQAASGHLHQYLGGLSDTLGKYGVKVQSKFNPVGGHSNDGSGSYKINVGPYQIDGQHQSIGGQTKHSMSGSVDPKASPDQLKHFKPQYDTIKNNLNTVGNKELERPANSVDKSEPLEKDQPAITLPRVKGISTRPDQEVQPIGSPRQREVFARKTSNTLGPINAEQTEQNVKHVSKIKDVPGSGVSRLTPRGPVSGVQVGTQSGTFSKTPKSLKSPATKDLSREQMEQRGKQENSLTHHEALHHTMGQVEQKYGKEARKKVVDDLVNKFDPKTASILGDYVKSIGYKPDSPYFKEEMLTAARDILTNPDRRGHFRAFTGHGESVRHIANLKSGHKAAHQHAKTVDHHYLKNAAAEAKMDAEPRHQQMAASESMVMDLSKNEQKASLLTGDDLRRFMEDNPQIKIGK